MTVGTVSKEGQAGAGAQVLRAATEGTLSQPSPPLTVT